MTPLQQLYSPTDFRKNAHELVDMLADYLEKAQSNTLESVLPWASPDENLAYWDADFQASPNNNPSDFFKKIIDTSIHLHHPRYMGHQVAVPAPLAALSGMLTGMLNNGMAVYEMGLVSNPLERIVTDWIAKKFGRWFAHFGWHISEPYRIARGACHQIAKRRLGRRRRRKTRTFGFGGSTLLCG
jgi:L-2,4-diaminobutyrate decarboxylase